MDFSKVSVKKPPRIRAVIRIGLEILKSVQVPLDDLTPRRLEKMSMCLLALASIKATNSWEGALSVADKHVFRTREIIDFINCNFKESISSGSYDDIRRKDLIRLVGMGLVVKSANNPDADTNDGTRGYGLEENFAVLIRAFGTDMWAAKLKAFKVDTKYIDNFIGKRVKNKLVVTIEDDLVISLDDGPHNKLQKKIIESFLSIYGYGASVLYIGDTSEKKMYQYTKRMVELGLDIEDRGMLPDIIAFSDLKQWVFLIEAVHSSNPLNPERCIELQRTVLRNCAYGVVYVTAFLSRRDFSKWMTQIAWETEVWLADSPEHLIHFNGDRFLGPHLKS